MSKRTKIFLCIIVLVAAALRLYRLSDVPPGVNRDEASVGVTAYSLMTTGRDEYGRFLPLSFESFGDWKLPLYIYAAIPFVKIFGLSELAVRLPSALAGIASVAALYYLVLELFQAPSIKHQILNKHQASSIKRIKFWNLEIGAWNLPEQIALLSAFVLAIMPWHIHISRVESEAIVALLFTILGSLTFLRSLKEKSLKKLTISSIFFAATYWTYHGNHVSTSLLILGLAGLYWQHIVKIPRWWIAVATGVVLTLIILSVTVSADHTKIGGISIFGDPTVVHNQIELPRLAHDNPNALTARLAHNRLTYTITTVLQNYLKSYGPDFLFIRGGGNKAHNIQGFGNLHPIDALLLLLGISTLIVTAKHKHSKFILLWIAIGGIAAAITKDAPHSNRMLAVVPSLAIAIAAGIHMLFVTIAARAKKIFVAVLSLGYLISMAMYLDMYMTHFPKNEAANWGYAYKKLTPVLFTPEHASKNVVMTYPQTSPYIFLLFYNGYSPARYQKEATRYPISNDGFTDVSGFGRFSFRGIDWNKDPALPNTLLVARKDEVPGDIAPNIISEITLPDNTVQFVVIDTDK